MNSTDEMREKYKKLLNEGEFALLKSSDEYYLSHYKGSPLHLLTGFSGSAGYALIEKSGKITLFVDPRYHEQADCETKGKNVEVIKLNLGDSFSASIGCIVTGSKLYVPKSLTFSFYNKLKKENLDIILYEEFIGFGENKNPDLNKEIFDVKGVKSFKNKVEILSKKIKSRYILVTSLEEIAYLTNLRSYQMPNTSTFRSKLLLDFKNTPVLFCNDEIKKPPEGLIIKSLEEFSGVIQNIKEEIVVNSDAITLGDYDLIKNPVFEKTNYIARMASIKEKCEIEHLKSAFSRLDKALLAFKKQIKPGLSELDLKDIFERELIASGAYVTSFTTILATGENSSSIHYSNYDKNKILKNGDLILLDCGGYYEDGLATDITRVFLCGNAASLKQKEIYTAVLKAFLNAYHLDSAYGDELDEIARKILKPYEKQGFAFPHALGHGIGIPVHQSPPVISSYNNKKFPLRNNMTHTIEPGLYGSNGKEKLGIRLENSVYVTGRAKRKSFSKFEFEENLIERTMLTKKEQKWLDEWQKDWKDFCERHIGK